MFEVPNSKMRSKIINYLRSSGVGIKNVPDAIRWHFASYWGHAISKKQINSIKSQKIKLKDILLFQYLLKLLNKLTQK